VFQHTLNATAALVAAERFRKTYPDSQRAAYMANELVQSTKRDRLREYALALRTLRERAEEEWDCIDVELVPNNHGASSTTGEV
jgi:hypothetical protein